MEYLQLSPKNLHRRVFIKGVGYVSLGLLLGTLGGCEELAEAIRNRPIRRRLRTGSALVDADIATYKEAVRLMKELTSATPSDPRGWLLQSAIHGTNNVDFNFCQHGTNHFFSWHRAYLFYFEKICQKLTGNSKFGLPYWNWNQDPAIHAAFLDTSSSLYLSRTRTTMAGRSSISSTTLDTIFSDTNFFTFGNQIEGSPHNDTHSRINGTFGNFGSPLDPIFWPHHCMVDYCWAKWNIEMGRDNPNDTGWNGTEWNHFVNEDGASPIMSAGLTTIMPLLSYQYESSVIGSNPATPSVTKKAEFRKLEKRVKDGADIKFIIKERIPIIEKVTISITQPFSQVTTQIPSGITRILENKEKETIFASIEYAQLPSSSDFFVRVFINKPDAIATTPVTDPHYAGSFAFFGTEPTEVSNHDDHREHRHQPRFLVNILPTLQSLKKRGELKDDNPVSVQLVAVPHGEQFEKPDTRLILNKVELIITPVIIPSRKN